jgi:hypothetical protein
MASKSLVDLVFGIHDFFKKIPSGDFKKRKQVQLATIEKTNGVKAFAYCSVFKIMYKRKDFLHLHKFKKLSNKLEHKLI